ncbi:non-canonical purine NTP pyrophosphatase [Patescibacteria group bacterium]|nr:non-canonical purine NTP pyrophosphatase [Patescibacteria group bacterium]
MKKIIFVTSNKGKYNSARRVLKRFGIKVIQKSIAIPESRGSIEEIAIQKAKYAYKTFKEPLIVNDTGFFVKSLNGFPMMFTSFALETIGNEGILKLAEGKARDCEFKEILCYLDGSRKKPKIFERIVKGKLAFMGKGELKPHHWGKLALIFIPLGRTKTLGEMTDEEYDDFHKKIENRSHWEQFGKFYSNL